MLVSQDFFLLPDLTIVCFSEIGSFPIIEISENGPYRLGFLA